MAESELMYTFESDVKSSLSMARLIELNQASTHPVTNVVLQRRYITMKALDGLFWRGSEDPGRTVDQPAGRPQAPRHLGDRLADEPGGMEKFSVGTVIRAYLIEHEIAIGTDRLFFEGGTPHSVRHAFISEKTTDIVVTKRSPFVFALRRSARWRSISKNFLMQTLVNPALRWDLR